MGEPSQNDKIEIEANANGGKISMSGDGASRLMHAAADIISPLSNGLGAIGDALGRFRIYREAAATAALERAKEIKLGRGEAIHPISAKTLSLWIEGASAEDIESDNIIELWARILASSPGEFQSQIAAYIDICRHIGRREVTILRRFIVPNYLQDENLSYETRDWLTKNEIRRWLVKRTEDLKIEIEGGTVKEEMEAPFLPGIPGIIITQRHAFDLIGGSGSSTDTCSPESREAIQVLIREGLLDFQDEEHQEGSLIAGCKYVQATRLAYSFVRFIYPNGLTEWPE